MSHVVVLGAGIIGITSAYYLNRAGHQVTVIERNAEAGLKTSYANGGQLSYSYVAPLAGPGVIPKIPPWLLRLAYYSQQLIHRIVADEPAPSITGATASW